MTGADAVFIDSNVLIAASVSVRGVQRLATFNTADFRRYEAIVTLEAMSS
jgi:predicted nucleic acid-binding protein